MYIYVCHYLCNYIDLMKTNTSYFLVSTYICTELYGHVSFRFVLILCKNPHNFATYSDVLTQISIYIVIYEYIRTIHTYIHGHRSEHVTLFVQIFLADVVKHL